MSKEQLEAEKDVLKNFLEDDDDAIIENNDDDLDNDVDTDITGDVIDDDKDDNDDDDGDDDRKIKQDDDDDDNDDQDTTFDKLVKGEDNNDGEDDDDEVQLGFKADAKGNLVDKDGSIVFARGKPRAIFTKIKKALYQERNSSQEMRTVLDRLIPFTKELKDKYKELRDQANYPKDKGLSEEELKGAVDLMVLSKVDPKAAVRSILTKLHLQGTDLSDLGVNGPLDAKVLAEHMANIQDAKKQQENKELTPEERARKEATEFLDRFPSARPHTGLVIEAKRRFPQMSLDEIWFEIRLAATRKKSDKKPSPGKTPARNSSRPQPDKAKKLSLKAVDPNTSYKQIGKQLLSDLQELD